MVSVGSSFHKSPGWYISPIFILAESWPLLVSSTLVTLFAFTGYLFRYFATTPAGQLADLDLWPRKFVSHPLRCHILQVSVICGL